MGVVELFMTDFCPFAQRAWIAFLEKESDPSNPKLFHFRDVNYYNPSLPETKEFLKLSNTVPVAVYDGQVIKESLPVCYWVDETLAPDVNPLQPSSSEGKATMKALIEKYTSGQFDMQSVMKYLQEDCADKRRDNLAHLLAAYEEMARDIAKSGGPFLMGKQFTIADIALISFVQRAFVLLGHYQGFKVPQNDQLKAFHEWLAACEARPSVRISSADRLPRSVAVQPFAATKRNDYLIEATAMYGNNVREIVRKQLLQAPPGVSTQNIPAAIAEKEAAKSSA